MSERKTVPTTEPSLNQVGRVMEEFWHPNAGTVDGNRMAREIAALRNAGCEALLRIETLTSELHATAQQLAAAKAENAKAEGRVDWEEEYEAMYDAISSLLPPDDKRMLVERVAALHADAARWRWDDSNSVERHVEDGDAGRCIVTVRYRVGSRVRVVALCDRAERDCALPAGHDGYCLEPDALRHEQQEEGK